MVATSSLICEVTEEPILTSQGCGCHIHMGEFGEDDVYIATWHYCDLHEGAEGVLKVAQVMADVLFAKRPHDSQMMENLYFRSKKLMDRSD